MPKFNKQTLEALEVIRAFAQRLDPVVGHRVKATQASLNKGTIPPGGSYHTGRVMPVNRKTDEFNYGDCPHFGLRKEASDD